MAAFKEKCLWGDRWLPPKGMENLGEQEPEIGKREDSEYEDEFARMALCAGASFGCGKEVGGSRNTIMKIDALAVSRLARKGIPWLVVAPFIGIAVYQMRFSPVAVTTHRLEAGLVVEEVMGTGTLEARVKTVVSPRLQERLAEVLVDQGDAVKAGQLLARLDDAELKQQVTVAGAALAAARASAGRVKADEARAEAVVRQARLDHQRTRDLFATKVVSQSDVDKATEQLDLAEADVVRTKAAIAEADSQIATAAENLRLREDLLSFTRMVSPYDGLVVRRDRDPGGVVVPGSSILQIISTDEIWVSAWVDETAMAGLAVGQPARVVFRSEPAKSFAGEVARLGREADRETREFVADVRVKTLPQNWAIGQRAEVFIETGRDPSALALPLRFVSWRDGKPGVYIDANGKARWREVRLGLRGLETVGAVGGLSRGDVVCRPIEMKREIKDGQRVSAR